MDGDRPLQLREVAEMIRKGDDSQAVVKGLSLLPALIEAAPDELANYSSEHSWKGKDVADRMHCSNTALSTAAVTGRGLKGVG